MKKLIISIISILTLSGISYTKPDNINVMGNLGGNAHATFGEVEFVVGAALGVDVQPEWIFKGEKVNIGIGPIAGIHTSYNTDMWKAKYFAMFLQANIGVRYDVYFKKNGIYVGNEFSFPLGITIEKEEKVGIDPAIPINIKTHVGKKFKNGLKVGGYFALGSKGVLGIEVGKEF